MLDKHKARRWEVYQVVLWYLIMDVPRETLLTFVKQDFLLALLYLRSPEEDEGDRIWSIYCKLKHVPPWSYDDPLQDKEIMEQLERLKNR